MPESQDYLIHEFVELYYDTLDNINSKVAEEKYLELYSQYQRILQSSLAPMHKKIAHDRIDSLYNQMQKASNQKVHYHLFTTRHIAVISLFILLIGGVVFLKPSIVGLATLDIGPQYVHSTTEFLVPAHTTLILDGNELFSGNNLAFLITEKENIDVRITNALIAITPLEEGSYDLTLIASQDGSVARIPITIRAE
jgi:hypothetical protein